MSKTSPRNRAVGWISLFMLDRLAENPAARHWDRGMWRWKPARRRAIIEPTCRSENHEEHPSALCPSRSPADAIGRAGGRRERQSHQPLPATTDSAPSRSSHWVSGDGTAGWTALHDCTLAVAGGGIEDPKQRHGSLPGQPAAAVSRDRVAREAPREMRHRRRRADLLGHNARHGIWTRREASVSSSSTTASGTITRFR